MAACCAPSEAARPAHAGLSLRTRSVDAGKRASAAGGRIGRGTKFPPQLGQVPCSRSSTQGAQKVHSKEQIRASALSGGRSRSQHSQFGFSLSMGVFRRRSSR